MSDKKSWWGFGVFAFYGAFVLFVLAMVLFVSLQDFQMVADDYYQEDLEFQDQIDRLARTVRLEQPLGIYHRLAENQIEISLPDSLTGAITGDIRLFRPSNADLDRMLTLAPDSNGRYWIDTKDMASGLWRVKVDWAIDSIQYYTEKQVMIP